MTGEIYTGIADRLCQAAGIDLVGVVSNSGETAIAFAGTKTLRKYMDGTTQISIMFNISGISEVEDQRELIEKLCNIGDVLKNAELQIEEISQPKVQVSSPPLPAMRNGRQLIYTMGIEIIFYTRKGGESPLPLASLISSGFFTE